MLLRSLMVAALFGLAACSDGSAPPSPAPANSAPQFSSAAAASAPEGSAGAVYTATASDADGDAVTFSIVGGADAARFSIVGGATLTSTAMTRRTDEFLPDVGTIDLIASFGTDDAGNVYIVDLGGEIFRLENP